MEPACDQPSLSALGALARDLLRRTIRQGILHAFAGSLLFLAAASATCRIAFASPEGGSLVRTLGKTGIIALYMAGGAIAGSLYGASSAILDRLEEIGTRVSAFLDTELIGKIPANRTADDIHAFRLRLQGSISRNPALRILRLFPFVGTLLRTLETHDPSPEGGPDPRARLCDALVGSATDDLRRQASRAKRFAILLAAGFLSVPVLYFLVGP